MPLLNVRRWLVSSFVLLTFCLIHRGEALGTFGFDIHHRYSDSVKELLTVDGLPEMGSLEYYAAMAHRDKIFNSRRHLADTTPAINLLTFSFGNQTFYVSSLGFLHYAIVEVGTPKLRFIVALDTGSDLFWLPCECTNCVRSLNLTSGRPVELNMYSLNTSSTGKAVPCNSPMCGARRRCSLRFSACAYQEVYLSSNTSSTGILVDDVLHLTTHGIVPKPIQAPITLGCGIIQTGAFLRSGAPNGLFGLGMDNVSVPSILAGKGLVANSFSMCFGADGIGRIEFGDKGSPDQKTTSFNLDQLHPTYNVTVAQVTVGRNVSTVAFSAVVDSGTSFTYLTEPAYSAIAEIFNAQITLQPRYVPTTKTIFEYCYELSATEESYTHPKVNFTMKGGSPLYITDPTVVLSRPGGFAFCLAMVKSEDINIIGQNFLNGYRIVFDREEMVLGWKDSDCYDAPGSNTIPVTKPNTTIAPAPPPVVLPEVMPNRTRSFVQPPPPPPPSQPTFSLNGATKSSSFLDKFLGAILAMILHHFFILY